MKKQKPEIWKPTKELGELYQISNRGRVRRNWYGKWRYLKNGGKYQRVFLSRSGIQRQKQIPKLVMESFQGVDFDTLPKGITVVHLDGIKTHNEPENLALPSQIQKQEAEKPTRWKKEEVEKWIKEQQEKNLNRKERR